MQRGGKTARGRYYGADVGSTTSQRRPTPLAPRTPSPLKMRDYAHRHRDPFFTKLAAEFHQAGHLDIGNKHHARVFVVEGREPLEDGLHEMLGHGGDDHDQHVILVEHEMAFVEAVTPLAGQIVDDGVALDPRPVEDVRDERLVLTVQDDLQFLERTEIEVFHNQWDSSRHAVPIAPTRERRRQSPSSYTNTAAASGSTTINRIQPLRTRFLTGATASMAARACSNGASMTVISLIGW